MIAWISAKGNRLGSSFLTAGRSENLEVFTARAIARLRTTGTLDRMAQIDKNAAPVLTITTRRNQKILHVTPATA